MGSRHSSWASAISVPHGGNGQRAGFWGPSGWTAGAGRRAAGTDAAHDQTVVVGRGLEAEDLPGELVGARGGEGRGGDLHLVVAAVAAQRQRDAVALAVVPDALLELVARGHLPSVDARDRVAAHDAGG